MRLVSTRPRIAQPLLVALALGASLGSVPAAYAANCVDNVPITTVGAGSCTIPAGVTSINVIAVGGFAGTINFGGQNLVSAGGTDAWIASFSPNGTHLWSRAGAGTNNQTLSGVSSDVFGNVTATGFLSDSADFGGGALPSNGGQDIVVARYSPTGTHLWSKSYGAAGTEVGRATAGAATGEVFITGLVTSPTDFGGGLMVGGGGEDIFLLKVAP